MAKRSKNKVAPELSSASQAVRDFIDRAHERFKESSDAEQQWRRDMLDDWKFYGGEQWPADVKTDRAGQPCLTINRLPGFKNLVTNELRQQRPAVQVNPVSNATVDEAKIVQGLIRHYEVQSEAETVYDMGGDGQVIGGLGAWRIMSEWKGKSFTQDIFIRGIENIFSLYGDPNTQLPDRSDSQYEFITKDYTEAEYKREYPNSQLAGIDDFQSIGDNAATWMQTDKVRVAEYYYLEYEDVKIHELEDGSVVDEVPKGQTAKRSRTVNVPTVYWSKINAVECLEGGPDKPKRIPCSFIPICRVFGEVLNIDGKRTISGLIRNSKDAQRAYNYAKSKQTEAVALAPLSPFIVEEGQVEGRPEWATANRKMHSTLKYKMKTDSSGSAIPPPARNNAEPAIQAITILVEGAANDLQATTGINDASLGQRRPDESGKATLARQKQGDIGTLHYSDNLARTIRKTGKALFEFACEIEDYAHVQRIVGSDGVADHVVIHSGADQLPAALALRNFKDGTGGKKSTKKLKVFDISAGTYDFTVSVGPSYQTKRQEAVASIMALIQAAPEIMQVVGDLLVGNMDWNNSQEIAARLKKMVPPQYLDDQSDDPAVKAQKSEAQLKAMAVMTQQLSVQLQKVSQIINSKQLELESKERIAGMNNQAEMIVAAFKANAAGAQAMMDAQNRAIEMRLEKLHESIGIDQETNQQLIVNAHQASLQPQSGQPGAPDLPPQGAPAQ